MNWLFEHCSILTRNKNGWVIKQNMTIAIKNGLIVDVKKGKKYLKNYTKVDCKNKIIMPGLCNAHVHLGDTCYRGIINNVSLSDYLIKTELHNQKVNDNHRRKISAQITIFDLIRNGITSCCFGRGWPILKKINYYGMSVLNGYVVMNIDRLNNEYKKIKHTFDFQKLEIEKYSKNIKIGIFIHSLSFVDQKTLKEVQKIVQKYHIKTIIHIGENNKKNSGSELKILEKYNLLSKDSILIHCTNIVPDDYRLLKKYKPNIVLCPSSNLKLLTGVTNFKKISETGCNICIATDGGATNNSLNLLGEGKLSSLLYNYQAKKFVLDENKILDSIIINPIKALGLDKIGLIKKGYRADLIMIDKKSIAIQPEKSIINNLIFSGDNSMIKEVMIDGNFVIVKGDFFNKKFINKKISLFNKLCEKI